jgi:hypothetical protein
MAKVTMLLSLFCFFITSTNLAQDTRFGIKAGLNYASVVGDLTEGIKFRFSGHGGIYLESEFSDKFAFQIDLLYSSQGFQFSSDLQSIENTGITLDQNDFRTNVQLNFLTVPIVGKFALNDLLAVEFGPQFGFLLNQVSKIKNLDQRDDTIPDNRTSISGDFQLDYGVVAGLDIKVDQSISVAPRFYIGLRNRLNGLGGTLQNYNVAIQVSVNYLIF